MTEKAPKSNPKARKGKSMAQERKPRMTAARREERLLEFIKAGETDGELILNELRIKEPNEAMALAFKICAENNLVPPKIDFGVVGAERILKKKIGKNMTMGLSRPFFEALGFSSGDTFIGKRDGDNIILEKVK